MLVISFLLVMAASAHEAPATTPAAQPDKIVCKSEQQAHSRIPERVCRLQSEWAQIAKQTEDDLRRSSNQRLNPQNPQGR